MSIKIQAFQKKIEQFNKQKVNLSSKFNKKRDEETLALLKKLIQLFQIIWKKIK